MLWVGWYGFNAGSALGADGIAANAFMTTTLGDGGCIFQLGRAGMVAVRGKPSACSVFVRARSAGLLSSPRRVDSSMPTAPLSSVVLAGAVPFFACTKLKSWFHYDDALDTFGVHAGWRNPWAHFSPGCSRLRP